MSRWDAFAALCGYLRGGLLGGERPASRDISWESLIEIASFHYVTPTLGWCLGEEADVPPEVGEYFAAAASLNGRRNELMLTALARTVGVLNEIGIEPIPLKGAAHLADALYPDPSLRLLGDLDMLIPAQRAADVLRALHAAGFAGKPNDVLPPPQHHHLPVLYEPETGAGLELHTDVISQSPQAVIATAWFCEQARPATFRGQRILLPEPTRHAGHIVFHSQVAHERHGQNTVQLRHLLDLTLLQKSHAGAIDWDMLDRRFSAADLGEVLATYLLLSEELFGQPAPKLTHAARRNALEDMRRAESRDGFHVQIETLKEKCDRLLTELSHMTVSRDHYRSLAENLEYGLQHTTAAHDHFRAEARRLEAELIQLAAARAELAAAHGSALQLITKLERELAVLRASTSWRLTSPLRALGTALRRLTGRAR